jgi:hypothetical protein
VALHADEWDILPGAATMKSTRASWTMLAGIGLLLFPLATHAQLAAETSPRPYVIIVPDNLEASLQEKLKRFSDVESIHGNLDDLFKKLSESGLLEDQKVIRDLIKDKGNLEKAQDVIDKIRNNKKLREEIEKRAPDLAQKIKDQGFRESLKKEIEKQQQAANNRGHENRPPPAFQEPAQTIPPSRLQEFLEQLKGMEGVGRVFRDSPTMRKLVSDMAVKALQNQSGNNPFDVGDFTNNVEKAGDFFSRSLDVFRGGLASAGGLPMPSLPSPPRLPIGNVLSNVPRFGSPGPGGGWALGHVLLWGGIIVIAILIVWQLKNRGTLGIAFGRAGKDWRLGPWPVDPARVATRAELIQAFEYLSLLILGAPARTWNHIDIAFALGERAGGPSAEKRQAADRLASLYEEARYAPEDEPLTAAELAEARRNRCYLAGVAAA